MVSQNSVVPHVDAGPVNGAAVGAGELTAEDLAGILGLRYTKFQVPPSPNGQGWDMKVVLERTGQPAQTLMSYGMGHTMPPFLVAFDWSRPKESEATLYLAHVWNATHQARIPQPYLVPNMRSTATPLREGRTVIVLWSHAGGWDPGDADFVQRIVVDLRSRARTRKAR